MTRTALAVDVRPVRSASDRKRFVRLPWRIYRDDPNWVPPLVGDALALMSTSRNPFFEHAEAEHFLAWRDGEPIGRIAAIENRLHNDFHDDRVGFFGFFECVDDDAVAQSLTSAAGEWLAGRSLNVMRGPMNYSTNDTCGLLVDGFDGVPYVMMTYNPSYYPRLVETCGFTKAKDLLAYRLTNDVSLEGHVDRVERLLRRRRGARVRSLRKKRWHEEIEIIRNIYNAAWHKNWGFIPYTRNEFDHMAAEMKRIVDPDLVGILEVDGQPVGFGLGLPDVNLALRRANGRLFPFGIFKVLLASRRIDRIRVPILGVLESARGQGYDALLYVHLFRNGVAKGYREGELSWILEDNLPMRRGIEKLGGAVYRTYRIYDKSLA